MAPASPPRPLATPSWPSSNCNLRHVRLPFVDTVDKAHQAVRQINHTAEIEGKKPHRLHHPGQRGGAPGHHRRLQGHAAGHVRHLRPSAGRSSWASSRSHRIGRFSDVSKSQAYHDRIEAINFSLAHDDGQSNRDLEQSDVILVGVSRSGKTPDFALSGDAVRPESLELPADPGRLRAPAVARRRWCRTRKQDLRPDDPAGAARAKSATSAGPTPTTPRWRTAAWRWAKPKP